MSLRLFPGVVGRLAAARPVQTLRSARPSIHPAGGPRTTSSGPRLDARTFFTPRRPPPSSGSGPGAAPKSQPAPSPWAAAAGFTGAFFRRAFSSSRPSDIIRTQWVRGQPRRPRMTWWQRFRWRLDQIPPRNLTIGILAINGVVFLGWQYGMSAYQRFGDPSAYWFMVRNFILNMPNVLAGRVWVLLTSCFSHMTTAHILVNSIGLWFAAPAVASILGTSGYLLFYLGAGLFSAICSLAWQSLTPGRRVFGSEGASGAIYGCMAFFGTMFPRSTFLLFFVIPMPAWALLSGVFVWDLWNTMFNPASRIDGAGHIGGIIAGVATAVVCKRRYRRMW